MWRYSGIQSRSLAFDRERWGSRRWALPVRRTARQPIWFNESLELSVDVASLSLVRTTPTLATVLVMIRLRDYMLLVAATGCWVRFAQMLWAYLADSVILCNW